MINEFILMGWAKTQPELKYWEKGEKVIPVVKLQLDSEKDTIEVCAFGDVAESVSSEVSEGDLILVKGRVKGKIDENKKLVEIYARTIKKVEIGG